MQIFKDCFTLSKTSHWTATCSNTLKGAQHWNIWWVCNRLCHYHPKAVNGNILLIFVCDRLADGLWGLTERDDFYLLSTVCTCMWSSNGHLTWLKPRQTESGPWGPGSAWWPLEDAIFCSILSELVLKVKDESHQPTLLARKIMPVKYLERRQTQILIAKHIYILKTTFTPKQTGLIPTQSESGSTRWEAGNVWALIP